MSFPLIIGFLRVTGGDSLNLPQGFHLPKYKLIFLGGGFKYFWNFHPDPWGNDPI